VAALAEAASALTRTIAGYGGQLGLAFVDIPSGELLAAANDRRPLNPASNAKLFTAAAALSLLHPSYRFETGLYGQERGGTVAYLVLRGHGDPSLTTKDLMGMVRELKDAGVRRVDGDGWLTFEDPNTKVRQFHHGGLFALTRWTNLYFQVSNLLWGDAIGGKVAPVFGRNARNRVIGSSRFIRSKASKHRPKSGRWICSSHHRPS